MPCCKTAGSTVRLHLRCFVANVSALYVCSTVQLHLAARLELLGLGLHCGSWPPPAAPQVTKNHFASEFVCNKYRFEKTCDVIEVDAPGGVTKVAEPVGVIAGWPQPRWVWGGVRPHLRCIDAHDCGFYAPTRQPVLCTRHPLAAHACRPTHPNSGACRRCCGQGIKLLPPSGACSKAAVRQADGAACALPLFCPPGCRRRGAYHQPHLHRHLQGPACPQDPQRPGEARSWLAMLWCVSQCSSSCSVLERSARERSLHQPAPHLRALAPRAGPARRPRLPACRPRAAWPAACLALPWAPQVLCPHPRARRCTIEAARIVHEAAVAAGAPRHIISWIEHPSMCISQALMQSPEISLILATGGPQMVRRRRRACRCRRSLTAESTARHASACCCSCHRCCCRLPPPRAPLPHPRRCAPPTRLATPRWAWARATRPPSSTRPPTSKWLCPPSWSPRQGSGGGGGRSLAECRRTRGAEPAAADREQACCAAPPASQPAGAAWRGKGPATRAPPLLPCQLLPAALQLTACLPACLPACPGPPHPAPPHRPAPLPCPLALPPGPPWRRPLTTV